MKKQIEKDNILFKVSDLHKIALNKGNKLFIKDGIEVPVDQLPVLMVLYYEGEMSQQDIADKLLRDKSSILRSIASLEAKKFVMVSNDGFDKRKKVISLTPEGNGHAVLVAKELTELDKIFFSCLTAQEREQFKALLAKCSNHIKTL